MASQPVMRRGLLALCLCALPLAGAAQVPAARLHTNLPASYPFDALPRGVVVAPQSGASIARAGGDPLWSEARSPTSDVLRPRDAWASPTRELDANTRSPAGTRLNYREVFSPSVSPFKRTQSFDAVDARGHLYVRDPVLRPLRVGPAAAAPGEPMQRFTGDVNVELTPDNPTAIPSVAAEPRVVAYRTVPEVNVAFFRDSAGNLYARGARAATVRLTWVMEAPERMFVPRAVPVVPLASVASRLGVEAPTVPPFLAADAPAVLATLGLRAESDLAYALERITARFRAFRDADLPGSPAASLYRTLATGGVGACRHRAYAAALTLHALGVPARYVGNEAHAWIEVNIPDNGWTRVDLGGWDVPFHEEGSDARQAFIPQQPDPFPRPAEYTNGYSTRDARNAPRAARGPDPRPTSDAGAPEVDDAEAAAGAGVANATGPTGTTTSGTATGAGRSVMRAGIAGAAGVAGSDAESDEGAPSGASRRRDDESAVEAPRRVRPTLRLQEVSPAEGDARGFVRGTLVRCSGEARDEDDRPAADLPIQVELFHGGSPVTVERGGRRSAALGTTVTDTEGRFEARVLLPYELGAGTYELRVRTPGDARRLPARSD